MPKVTQAHIDARRQQILDAARACFGRRGFHQTTTQEICREAGLSPGALYGYFRSKEEIIEAMGEETRRRNAALIETIKEGADTFQALDLLASAFFRELDDPEACGRMCLDMEVWAEAMRNPRAAGVLRGILDGLRRALAEIVRQAQARGEVNPALDPDAVGRVILSLCEGLVLQKGIDREVAVWRYVDVVNAMITGSFWQGARPGKETSDVPGC